MDWLDYKDVRVRGHCSSCVEEISTCQKTGKKIEVDNEVDLRFGIYQMKQHD